MTDRGTVAETGELSRMNRSQEETAFAALLERHRRELHIHCYRMLASFDDAEDAVQDAFLRAWKYRDSRDEAGPVRPWLYRIATNACLDLIARDRKRPAISGRENLKAPNFESYFSFTREPLGDSTTTWNAPFLDRAGRFNKSVVIQREHRGRNSWLLRACLKILRGAAAGDLPLDEER